MTEPLLTAPLPIMSATSSIITLRLGQHQWQNKWLHKKSVSGRLRAFFAWALGAWALFIWASPLQASTTHALSTLVGSTQPSSNPIASATTLRATSLLTSAVQVPSNSLSNQSPSKQSLSKSVQREGCFDERRFCFLLSEKDDTSGSYVIRVQRFIDLPVALTLYSTDLGYKAHANAFLANNDPIILGETQSPSRFWSTMRVKWTVGNIGAAHNSEYPYASPLQPQQSYPIVQGVNGKFSHFGASKYALDFGASEGTPVLAARGGIVIDTKRNGRKGGPTPDFAKHANYVAILHDDGTTGEYYHLKYEGVVVKREQRITQGQLIGYTGNTGFSSLPHLHFGVYVAKFHGRYQSVPFSLQNPRL